MRSLLQCFFKIQRLFKKRFHDLSYQVSVVTFGTFIFFEEKSCEKTIVFKFKIKSIVLVSMGTGVQLRVRVRVFVCVCVCVGEGWEFFLEKKSVMHFSIRN